MNEVTLANFRCFREEQTARLAPLTLLVGDNSTGKTSFLALVRALWDVGFRDQVPDFKEPPYDLGSFEEIVHFRGHQDGASAFTAGFGVDGAPSRHPSHKGIRDKASARFNVTFENDGSAPVPVVRQIGTSDHWIEQTTGGSGAHSFRFGNADTEWESPTEDIKMFRWQDVRGKLPPLSFLLDFSSRRGAITGEEKTSPSEGDWKVFRKLTWTFRRHPHHPSAFASSPVRSQPRRTYDPTRLTRDSEGSDVPMYLRYLLQSNREAWNALKSSLLEFGQRAGLFDEIDVRRLGPGDGDPFQMRIAKYGKGNEKGPLRNLVDVGYGVSQVLPIVTELLRPDAAQLFLLQQPEVHLHPSAQAALGSLFCDVAANGRQLIVETHSDHLIDRVRMDVRDSKSKLRAEDVSLLFFERGRHDVRIHSLRFDDQGNVVGAPDGYRQFFMEETNRSVGLG